MGKKAAKATRKFASSGQLKKTIQQRRKHQDIKRKAERRKNGSKKGKEKQADKEEEESDIENRHDRETTAATEKSVRFHVRIRYTLTAWQGSRACLWMTFWEETS